MKKYITVFLILFAIFAKTNHISAQSPTNIYISEIMYDSPLNEDKKILKSHNNGEFIKLFNPTTTRKDISGWSLLGTKEYEQFVFPPNTIIESNGVLIVAYRDDEDYDFSDYYDSYGIKVLYQSAIIIYNKGEKLELRDVDDNLVDVVSFGKEAPPVHPDSVKVLFTDNNKNGVVPTQLNSLHRTDVYYSANTITSRGNYDMDYGVVSPTEGDYAVTNIQTSPIVKPIVRKIVISENTYPIVWFKTKPVSNNLQGTYKWVDVAGTETNATKLVNYVLPLNTSTEYSASRANVRNYNFNPAISIPANQFNKIILNKKSNLPQATIIGVWGILNENNLTENSYLFSLQGRSKESVLLTKKSVIYEQLSGKTDLDFSNTNSKSILYQPNNLLETETKYKEQSPRIGVYYMSNKPNTSLWGEKQSSAISLGGQLVNTNEAGNQIFSSTYNNFAGYNGYTPELLIFNKSLKPKEKNIFQSYLAIKYGISLDTTYTAPDGKVMWDYNDSQSYNNRITGYSRQDIIGFYQPTSTTAYEEANNYSYVNDAYDQNDCYRMSSRNKLLVIGTQSANYLKDGSFVLLGDNNDILSIPTENNIKNYKSLPRKWMVRTNIKASDSPANLVWNTTGLIISSVNGFKSNISKLNPVSSTLAGGTTSVPLIGGNGYFGWIVGVQTGTTIIKFGNKSYTLTPNSNDYGYKINSSGQIYKIERGLESSSSFISVSSNQHVEIEKNKNIIFLRINGLRIASSEIIITNTTDINAVYYGAISIQSTYQVTLTNFRHGGFMDTGNRVELSYNQNLASDFSVDKNSVYLIVDRSGTGNFNTASEYLVDEIDTERSKLIFNNVFWDTDGNGKDVFTFGYKNPTNYYLVKKQQNTTPEPLKENYTIAYYNDFKDLSRITVKVYLYQGEPYTLSVFDVSGRSVYRKDCLGSKEEQLYELQLPYPGFYVVKVMSKSYQYSTKVISN